MLNNTGSVGAGAVEAASRYATGSANTDIFKVLINQK
jgi:hypothetical protein